MKPIGRPETSVRNYHYTLRNNAGEEGSRLHRGGSLKSHKIMSRKLFSPGCGDPMGKRKMSTEFL